MSKMKDLLFKAPQGELTDAFTGELFTPRSRNHYEVNDGKPVAPHVDLPRPTVRQRIENLISRGEDPLLRYVREFSGEDKQLDLDVPDDSEAPLTASEQNYLDVIAASVAESAPLPDEGLPRPDAPPPAAPPANPPGGAAPGGGGSPNSPPTAPAPAPAGSGTVPSR